MTGLRTSNTAQRIEVVEPPFQSHDFRRGAWLIGGGTLEDSTVQIGTGQDTTGVLLGDFGVFGSGGNTVRDSTVSARTGVSAGHGATIERSRVTGLVFGIRSLGELTRVSDSLVRVNGTFGHAVRAETLFNSDSADIRVWQTAMATAWHGATSARSSSSRRPLPLPQLTPRRLWSQASGLHCRGSGTR